MAHSDTRKFKTELILSAIKASCAAGQSVDREKLVGEYMLEFGASRRTISEYLSALESANKITIFDGNLFTPEFFTDMKAEKEIDPSGLVDDEFPGKPLNNAQQKLDVEPEKQTEVKKH